MNATPYIPTVAGPPAPLGPTANLAIIRPNNKPPFDPAPVGAQLALLAPVPGFAPAALGGPNWMGVKVLGDGTYGSVQLWEWAGPAAQRPVPDKIAIKVSNLPTTFLREEGRIMTALNAAASQHVVRLLVSPATIITPAMAAAEGLDDANWLAPAGRVRRLIMEYCPQGSLEKLIAMRQLRNIRFEELTLWRIFECLIDGCAVLEHGVEFVNNAAGVATIPPGSHAFSGPLDPGVVVHFDLKPQNIMTGDRERAGHSDTPVCKIGDFGMSSYVNRNSPPPLPTWAANQQFRGRGTPNYFAPEQFSDRWNHSDYVTGGICGRYGTKTNIWGIGQIMYERHGVRIMKGQYRTDLWAPFESELQASIPFTPVTIRGHPPAGRVFGTEIQYVASPPLSNELKDTIQQCLYEMPLNRPGLLTLKRRAVNNIAALVAAGARPEGWQNLNRLEPLVP
ncbi:kinase-like domain-containing protein [Leptodontidium sp. MPI-SDFR-AT-0119]|nr:kinase-like domain-containing protein [Leptodontidium sp. MPI-SDFR-AT-0119]